MDALYAHTPYLERALVEQGAVILVNQSAGEVPELAGGRQSHSLVTTRSFASANREVVVALARAIHRAQQLVHTDQQAAVRAILQSGIPDLDRKLVETIVEIYAPAIPTTPEVSVEGVELIWKSTLPRSLPWKPLQRLQRAVERLAGDWSNCDLHCARATSLLKSSVPVKELT